jgi:hypothetical protein
VASLWPIAAAMKRRERSGSGDIGGIVVHQAQGAKTLTVILSPAPYAGKRMR